MGHRTRNCINTWQLCGNSANYVCRKAKEAVRLLLSIWSAGDRVSGLAAFKKQYPDAAAFIIGGNGIPLEEFFRANPQELLFKV
jgi:hypothetical protein